MFGITNTVFIRTVFFSRKWYFRQGKVLLKTPIQSILTASSIISNMSTKMVLEAPERNKDPILEVLQKVIPEKFNDASTVNVLEIGAGSGQHAIHISKEMPNLIWHPTDVDEKYLESIKAYVEESQLPNVKQPIYFDVSAEELNGLNKEYDVIFSVNLVHISPWKCTEGLFKVAGELLPTGGILVTYGPYSIHGEITPESNVHFNENLKAENSEWGLRDIDELEKEAKKNSLTFDAMFDMPSNNKTLIWLKQEVSEESD